MSTTQPSHTYRLPWPPSVNHYWRAHGTRRYISRAGQDFRDEVVATCRPDEVLNGRLAVSIEAFPATARRCDLDNLLKATLDALEHAGIYNDDGQIDTLQIVRREKRPPGCLDVVIHELGRGNPRTPTHENTTHDPDPAY